jgi:hypothetical protein
MRLNELAKQVLKLPIHLQETLRCTSIEMQVETHEIADGVSFVR